jgi:phospholipid/cholesterol/gamma-HCH transport system substrate-binding protein
MKRSLPETVLGAVVVLVAGAFLTYSYRVADVGAGSGAEGYTLTADFSSVGGLKPGDNIQVSGVKVGRVAAVELVPDSYLARVHLNIRDGYEFPTDTAAKISSESLLGGLYLSLDPGAEEETLKDGGKIQFTQAAQNLEDLLGQFIFSLKDEKDKKDSETTEIVEP